MNIYSIPFGCRLIVLLLLMTAYAYYDFRRSPATSIKYKEYVFFLICAILGAIFGMINDAITSSISAEYFIFGKGILPGKHFLLRAIMLGGQAGFIAGGISGAFFLMANNEKPNKPALSYRQLFRLIPKTIVCAIMLAFVLPICFSAYDPLGIHATMSGTMTDKCMQNFVLVWWVHMGIYLGLAIGTILGLLTIRRLRSVNSER